MDSFEIGILPPLICFRSCWTIPNVESRIEEAVSDVGAPSFIRPCTDGRWEVGLPCHLNYSVQLTTFQSYHQKVTKPNPVRHLSKSSWQSQFILPLLEFFIPSSFFPPTTGFWRTVVGTTLHPPLDTIPTLAFFLTAFPWLLPTPLKGKEKSFHLGNFDSYCTAELVWTARLLYA